MTVHGERKAWHKFLAPAAAILIACASFVIGNVRADSADQTKWDEIKPDIQKIRAMPDPNQVVTKDQLVEIIRRLDEQTEEIRDDVKYLRSREERRTR